MSNETSGPRPTDAQGQFAVQGMTQRGEETTLTVSAASREDAITAAREQGIFPTSVKESAGTGVAAAPAGATKTGTHEAAQSVGGRGRKVVGAVMMVIGIALLIYFGLLS